MRSFRGLALVLAVGLGAGEFALPPLPTAAGPATEAMIGHMVYFTLADNSPAKARELVTACEKYLTKHAGETFFAAGLRAKAFTRDVNVQDWDVALHIVFKTKADHDRYQDAARHKQFIEENKANWKQVRVFDSEVEATR